GHRQQSAPRPDGEAQGFLACRPRAALDRDDLRAVRAPRARTARPLRMKVRIGTRGSRLALAQTEEVAGALRAAGAEVAVTGSRPSGDRLAQVALADFGGKALFVKEIEEALLSGQVDVGVHSLKDLPSVLPDGLALAAFPPREDPRDVLLTRTGTGWSALPAGAAAGTARLRRRAPLPAHRPRLPARPSPRH